MQKSIDILEDLGDVLVGIEDQQDNHMRLRVENDLDWLWQRMPK